jgi:glycerophosphoryl diester phosphodiesterase
MAWEPENTLANFSPFQSTEFLGPHPRILAINWLYVWLAHRLGKSVCPLDPWPEQRLGWYLQLGVDALLTNDPAKTLAALAEARIAL